MQSSLAFLLLGAFVCGACGGIATTSGEDPLGSPGSGSAPMTPGGVTPGSGGDGGYLRATGGVGPGSGGNAPQGTGAVPAGTGGQPGPEPGVTECGVTTAPTYDMPAEVSERWLEIVQVPVDYGPLHEGTVNLPNAPRVALLGFVQGAGNIDGTAFRVSAASTVLRVQPSFAPGYVLASERQLANGYVTMSTVRAAVVDAETHEFQKELQFVRCDG